jgi:hypothetical protein
LQRFIGERRIAGAQDSIPAKIHAQFLFEFIFKVDLRQNAKTLVVEGFTDTFESYLVRQIDRSNVSIANLGLRFRSRAWLQFVLPW